VNLRFTAILSIVTLILSYQLLPVAGNGAAAQSFHAQALSNNQRTPSQDQEYERAIMLLKAEKPKEALQIMRTLYAQGYSSPGFFYYSGRTMFKLKYYGAAIIMFMKAASLKPDSVDSLYWMALSYYNDAQYVIKRKGYQGEQLRSFLSKVVEMYSTVLHKDPKHAMASYDRAYTYGLMGESNLAIQDYMVAIKAGYKLEWSHALIGESYWLTGDPERAIQHFNKALKYNTRNEVAIEYLNFAKAMTNSPPSYIHDSSSSYFSKPNMMSGYEKHPSDPNSNAAHWNWERCGKWSGC
jgi:tetratricopeptide (TPR) repeat protein